MLSSIARNFRGPKILRISLFFRNREKIINENNGAVDVSKERYRTARCPLLTEMPSSSIQAANKVVKPVLEEMKAREAAAKKRGQYKSYTASEKAMIAKRACN